MGWKTCKNTYLLLDPRCRKATVNRMESGLNLTGRRPAQKVETASHHLLQPTLVHLFRIEPVAPALYLQTIAYTAHVAP